MKRAIAIAVSVVLVLMTLGLLVANRSGPGSQELSQVQFVEMLQSDLLRNIRLYYPPELGQVDGTPAMLHQIRGTVYETELRDQMLARRVPEGLPFVAKVTLTPELEDKLLAIPGATVVSPNSVVQDVKNWFARFARKEHP